MKVLLFILILSVTASAQKMWAVASVRDGDTLRLVGMKKPVRVLGINAPEISGPFGHKADYYGPEATEVLRGLLNGHSVRLGFEPKSRMDRCNDRALYYLFRDDGLNVSVEMVRVGAAIYERRFFTRYAKLLEKAEGEAKAQKRGMWKE